MQKCKTCDLIIPQARLDVLPSTEYCVVHSEEKPKKAFIEGAASHKGWEVVILDSDDPIVDYWENRQG